MTIRQPGLAPVVSERSHQAPLWRDRLVRHVISRAISNRLSVNTGQGHLDGGAAGARVDHQVVGNIKISASATAVVQRLGRPAGVLGQRQGRMGVGHGWLVDTSEP